MCVKAVSEESFSILYCPDEYKTQRMCDEAVDKSLKTLKLIPDWFVTSKMSKKLFGALYADENTLHFNEDFGNVVFSCNEMGIPNTDLNNNNLDDNFDEDHPDTIIHIKLLAWHTKFEKRKVLKKKISKKLMPIVVAWHPKRWWSSCISEDKKKEIKLIFTEGLSKFEPVVYNMWVLKHFGTKNCRILLVEMFKLI